MKKNIICALALFAMVGCGGGGTTGGGDAEGGGGAVGGGTTGGVGGATEGGGGDGSISGSGIQFNLSDAVAVLKVDPSSVKATKALSGGSNIFKLTSDGSLEDVFVSGAQITASTLYIAPDGKLYITFQTPINMGEKSCILVRLGRDNTGECVDDELTQINSFGMPTRPIQFDDLGNIYYSGRYSDGKALLRKKTPLLSESFDLINDNISISQFFVKGDGTVYFSGTSTPTSTKFFRKLSISGALENFINGADILFLYEMPDGNIYAGEWGKVFGVIKVTDAGVEDTLYIGYKSINGIVRDANFDVGNNSYDSCDNSNRSKYEGFCGMGGTKLSYYYRSPDDGVYVVAGYSGDSASLWQYWPTVKPVDTSVLRPTIVSGTMTTLIIAGYDASGKNKLISYNTGDNSEIDLLKGENIEIYHFSYSANSGRIIFDGLRFSDNKYIVGSIDTQSGNDFVELESGTKYEDMQFFE